MTSQPILLSGHAGALLLLLGLLFSRVPPYHLLPILILALYHYLHRRASNPFALSVISCPQFIFAVQFFFFGLKFVDARHRHAMYVRWVSTRCVNCERLALSLSLRLLSYTVLDLLVNI